MKTLQDQSCRALSNPVLLLVLLVAWSAPAATLHVWQDSPSPEAPFASWATAATNIQDAVDAAQVGDMVLVTNGVYAAGGRAVVGTMTNRVAVDKPITLQSVNGPEATVIRGAPAPGGGTGDGAVRCVYLGEGAVLSGFTLTNGFTRAIGGDPGWGGGARCGDSAVMTNCIITGNSAFYGGGAWGGTLYNCTLSDNSAGIRGGGCSAADLYNCLVTGNSAPNGAGGATGSTLYNCTVTGNTAGSGWGGVDGGAIYNSIVYHNVGEEGRNDAGADVIHYSCVGSLSPGLGFGNIDADPRLADSAHLSAESPCIGAGSPTYAVGTDIDGDQWNSPPSIGCDEFVTGAAVGPLDVRVSAAYTNVALHFPAMFTARIDGYAESNLWDFGDGVVVSNSLQVSHEWSAPGTYHVMLRAFNATLPEGVSATLQVHVSENPFLYVDGTSANPIPPYDSWATAATNIQDAVDAAQPGQTVLVTNGVYATGVQYGEYDLTYRVVVGKPITLQSVNGPETTVIEGSAPAIPDTWNVDGAVGCIRLGADARLNGFKLRNGWSPADEFFYVGGEGGGAVCADSTVITNCIIENNHAFFWGGGVSGGVLYDCILRGNSALEGGGAYHSTLYNCVVEQNTAKGADGGNYNNGGGAALSTLYNCTVTGNSSDFGGGAYKSTLSNCAVSGNTASGYGGGTCEGELYNCTVTGNEAASHSGGVFRGTMFNCIVYFNSAPHDANYTAQEWGYEPGSVLNHSCTTPLPDSTTQGTNNIVLDPRLAGSWHLSPDSPCRGIGNPAYAMGSDLDGEPWGSPPSIGCNEYVAGAATGPLYVSILADSTNGVAGVPMHFAATIHGYAAANTWDFFDGVTVSNRLEVSHAWPAAGVYPVVVRAYNQTWPGGVSAVLLVQVSAAPPTRILHVDAASANPVPPYNSWDTAAATIQDAVDAAGPGDTILVTNGVYSAGETNGDRVLVDKRITLRSVNGPKAAVIDGLQAVRCVRLATNAVMSGFTLTGGTTSGNGGGALCASSATLTNCVITGNRARSTGGGVSGGTLYNCTLIDNAVTDWVSTSGGGVYDSILYNCSLSENTAIVGGGAYGSLLFNCILSGNTGSLGGGAIFGALYNCTVTGNSASSAGGGVYGGTLHNSVVYFNEAPEGANYHWESYAPITFDYCCTTPLPASGRGNIDLDPQLASVSHLSASSPCIGAGLIRYASGTDIDGEQWASPPSIGCDEYRVGSVTGPLQVEITATYTNVTPGFAVGFSANISGRTTASVWDFGDGTVVSNRIFGVSHAWTEAGTYSVELRAYNKTWPEGVAAMVIVQVAQDPVYYVDAASTNPVAPFMSWATAATTIQDAVDAAFVNGTVLVTNGIYSTGGQAVFGTMTNRVAIQKPLTVQSVNGPEVTVIEGKPSPGGGNGDGAVRCVYLGSNTLLNGFTLTQGHTQTNGESLGAQSGGGAWCDSSAILTNCTLINNSANSSGGGVYGGTLRNGLLIGNSARSGGGARDCTLWNSTVSNNSASGSGGGVYGGACYSCTITNNSATSGGGGAYFTTLYNSVLSGNMAASGGGSYRGTLHNCTSTANAASLRGGGVGGGILYNCIVFFNSAPDGANFTNVDATNPVFYNSCTTPMPGVGANNITNAPLFVNTNGWSDLRLRFGSPGVDVGTDLSASITTDLDGNPRPLDGDGDGVAAFDMGAYEFDARSMIPPDWFTSHGLDPNDPQVVWENPDHDPYTTFQEWVADTDPTNGMSFFYIEDISKASPAEVSFQSSSNRIYTLWSTPQLDSLDWTRVPEAVAIPGTGDSMTLSDPTNVPHQFYRVEVNLP